MVMNLTPSGLEFTTRNTPMATGMTQLYSNSSFSMTTTAQTIFSQRLSDNSDVDAGLSSGAHILQMYISTNPYYSMGYTGLMYWFASETNDGGYEDIILHSAGHAENNTAVYARTRMVGRNSNTDLQFQIWANTTGAVTCNLSVYALRLT